MVEGVGMDIKHLAGEHDQKTHGRPNAYTFDEMKKAVKYLYNKYGNSLRPYGSLESYYGGEGRQGIKDGLKSALTLLDKVESKGFRSQEKVLTDIIENEFGNLYHYDGLEKIKDPIAYNVFRWAAQQKRAGADRMIRQQEKEEVEGNKKYRKEDAVVHATLAVNTKTLLKNGLARGTYVLDRVVSGNVSVHVQAALEQVLINNNGTLPVSSKIDVLSIDIDNKFLDEHAKVDEEYVSDWSDIRAYKITSAVSPDKIKTVKGFSVTDVMAKKVKDTPIEKWWSEQGFDIAEQEELEVVIGEGRLRQAKHSTRASLLRRRPIVAMYVQLVFPGNLVRRLKANGYTYKRSTKSEADGVDEGSYYVITAYTDDTEEKHLAGKHDQQSHGRDDANIMLSGNDVFYAPGVATLLRDDFAQKFGFIGSKKDITVNGQLATFEVDGVLPTRSMFGGKASPQYTLNLKFGGKRYKVTAIDGDPGREGGWMFSSNVTRRYGHHLRTPEEIAEMMSNLLTKHLPGQHDQTTHAGDRARVGVVSQNALSPVFDKKKWEAMSIPDRKAAWAKLTPQEQDRQADPTKSILGYQNELLAFAGVRPQTGSPTEAVAERLKSIGDLIMPDAHQRVQVYSNVLTGHLKDSGVDDDTARHIMLEVTDSLTAQESESMARQLGDHGIRHLIGDGEMALQILEQVPGADSPKAKAAVMLAAVFHDAGYMTGPSRVFLDDAHPRWGGQHFETNLRPAIEKALGSETADHISYMIDTHAGTFLDWDNDPVASALRVADNAALFQKEKLPGVFKYIPANVNVLEAVGSKTITVEEGRKQIIANISKSNLPDKVKAAMYRAGNEMNITTPKFTLGMMGGEIGNFTWTGDALNVFIKRSVNGGRLNNVLDLGQRQFSKWAEAFGVNPKEFGTKDRFDFMFKGKTFLRTYVTGVNIKSMQLKLFNVGELLEKAAHRNPIDDFLESMDYVEDIDWSKLDDRDGGDPDGDVPDEEVEEKAGTRLGAILGWERRQVARKRRKEDIKRAWGRQKQALQIQLDEATQSRDAKQANQLRAKIRSGDRVYAMVKSLRAILTKHQPGKHDQKTHAGDQAPMISEADMEEARRVIGGNRMGKNQDPVALDSAKGTFLQYLRGIPEIGEITKEVMGNAELSFIRNEGFEKIKEWVKFGKDARQTLKETESEPSIKKAPKQATLAHTAVAEKIFSTGRKFGGEDVPIDVFELAEGISPEGQKLLRETQKFMPTPKMSGEVGDAVDTYLSGEFGDINFALRSGGSRDEEMSKTIRAVDTAIKSSKAPANMVVYRGMGENEYEDIDVRDKAFLSTSFNPATAEKFMDLRGGSILLEIAIPKGFPSLHTGSEQLEVLLPRNTKLQYISESSRMIGGKTVRVIRMMPAFKFVKKLKKG